METLKKPLKPKILQLSAIDVSIETLMIPLINKLSEKGFDVICVCKDTGKFEYLNSLGLKMHDINIPRTVHPLKITKAIYYIYKHLKSERYDIIHVHTPIASVIARVAAKLANQKNVIYTAHGYYFHDEMKKIPYKIVYAVEKFSAKYLTDYLLLQSREDYELSINKKFKKKDKIIHLSNGVDIWNNFKLSNFKQEELDEINDELKIHDSFVFTFVGRLVKEKGIFELIKAFKKVFETHKNAKLLLVGGFIESERDTESYEKLKKEILHPGIIFLGYRKDIAKLMAVSNVFVLPSHREGLPRSIIEAMAVEKAVIATNIRGCREEVIHGENGYLFEKGNVTILTEYMENLISNPPLALEFGIKGREFVEQNFDEEKVLAKQIDLFNEILYPFKSKEL
ncbi:glycosyltransferase family 4 protein [Planococcus kocurii]|uniref:glycosyltransferase family 4 protein n=1 Tax=Planococcus kocurii TaxID=1374 RepID=UPI003D01DF85